MHQIHAFSGSDFWYTNNRDESFVHLSSSGNNGLFGIGAKVKMNDGEFLQVNTPVRLDHIVVSNHNDVLLAYTPEDPNHRIYFSNNCNMFPDNRKIFQLLTTVDSTIEEIIYVREKPDEKAAYFLVKMSSSAILLRISLTDFSVSRQATYTTVWDKLEKNTYTPNFPSLFLFNNNLYATTFNTNTGDISFSSFQPLISNVKDVSIIRTGSSFIYWFFAISSSGSLDLYCFNCNIEIPSIADCENLSLRWTMHCADNISKYIGYMTNFGYFFASNSNTVLQCNIDSIFDEEHNFTVVETYNVTSVDNVFMDYFLGPYELLSDRSFKVLRSSGQELCKNKEYYNENTKTISFPEAFVDLSSESRGIFKTQNKIFATDKYLTKNRILTELRTIDVINGSYSVSSLNRTLQEFKKCLPSDLAAVISPVSKTTTKIVASVNTSTYQKIMSAKAETNDYDIFTFSEGEVFGKSKNTIEGNAQIQYDYYKATGKLTGRVRFTSANSLTYIPWWTSTANLESDGSVSSTYVGTDYGTARQNNPYYSDQRISRGIVPLFAIKG